MTPTIWSVGDLCKAVSDVVSAQFDAVQVRGEISGFTQAVSGHCYFSLKDSQGQLRCAMFRRSAMAMGRLPRNGDQVQAQGRLGVYESRGDLQLLVESLKPLGQGAWFEEFLRLKQKLEQEGLFDAALKRPIPAYPRLIGVVTSLGAAALHDVATALRRRVPHIPVRLSPTPVQGAEAPGALMAALDRLESLPELDVILLVRGGGSMEDLWAFNDEMLVRRVRQCRVPVICGVGHETDFTLSDFAADLRAPTPTAAAELCAIAAQDRLLRLQGWAGRLTVAARRVLDEHSQHLDRWQNSLGRPQSVLTRQQAALLRCAARLTQALQGRQREADLRLQALARKSAASVSRTLADHRHRLHVKQAQLELLDPRQVLERGFSWLTDAGGHALTRIGQLSAGQQVQAVLADGQVDMRVLDPRVHG